METRLVRVSFTYNMQGFWEAVQEALIPLPICPALYLNIYRIGLHELTGISQYT